MTHETIRTKDVRNFLLIWGMIFTVIGFYPLTKGSQLHLWAVGVAAFFVLAAFIRPMLFTRFYTLWIKVGEFIGGIISKLVLFTLFYGLFTPAALALRVMGKDLLGKKLDKNSTTYWIKREKQPGSLKNQF